ncbi:MAG: ethanolamine utilization protein eutP, partial [Bacillota bacterium]|jgi:ethanolamine utilization protein EutP|nr:ethanolamine utilization protein eutP [Bacillota bacterium]
MKKIMIIGAIDSGKTSLVMALNGISGIATKTQSLEYKSLTIDTPGEFMENPRMYKALLSTSLEAKYIIFTQDSTMDKSIFPPKFATAFNCMTIGVITKIDHVDSNVEKAKKFLNNISLKGPVFEVSALTGEGIETLKEFVKL